MPLSHNKMNQNTCKASTPKEQEITEWGVLQNRENATEKECPLEFAALRTSLGVQTIEVAKLAHPTAVQMA